MSAQPKTATDVFGREATDKLAALAIDLLVAAPEQAGLNVYTAKVRWSLIHEGRELLEQLGVDWRALVQREAERRQEARERVHAERAQAR